MKLTFQEKQDVVFAVAKMHDLVYEDIVHKDADEHEYQLETSYRKFLLNAETEGFNVDSFYNFEDKINKIDNL